MNNAKEELLEFIKLAEQLREKDRETFLETKGYLRGLVHKEQLTTRKISKG